MSKKDINVVTSLVGKGLEREYLLLRELLQANDYYVNAYHYTNYAGSNFVRAHVNLFMEVMMPNVLSLSRENWLMPNSEWWDARNDQFLPRITKVLCKTQDCHRIWSAKIGADKCVYTGFLARDLYRPEVPRENCVLHVAGESEFKNTEAVVEAWKHPMLPHLWRPPLTVVTRQERFQKLCEDMPNVTCIPRAAEDELVSLMNGHRFHLIPSAYEGFGHILHEGLGCGALVITTDAAPMNTFEGIVCEWAVRVSEQTPRALAQLNWVTPANVLASVHKVQPEISKPKLLEERSRRARQAFLDGNAFFSRKFLELLEAL